VFQPSENQIRAFFSIHNFSHTTIHHATSKKQKSKKADALEGWEFLCPATD